MRRKSLSICGTIRYANLAHFAVSSQTWNRVNARKPLCGFRFAESSIHETSNTDSCDQRRFHFLQSTPDPLTRRSVSANEFASEIGIRDRIHTITPLKAKAPMQSESAVFERSRIPDDMQQALFDRKYPQVENAIEKGAS
jgi:hypothetical protein